MWFVFQSIDEYAHHRIIHSIPDSEEHPDDSHQLYVQTDDICIKFDICAMYKTVADGKGHLRKSQLKFLLIGDGPTRFLSVPESFCFKHNHPHFKPEWFYLIESMIYGSLNTTLYQCLDNNSIEFMSNRISPSALILASSRDKEVLCTPIFSANAFFVMESLTTFFFCFFISYSR